MNRKTDPFVAKLCAIALGCGYVSTAHASPNVYALTVSIVSYSKWNNVIAGNTTICVIDNPQAASALQVQVKQMAYHYKVLAISANQFSKTSCQAVFFSTTTPTQQQQLINSYPNKGLLSLSNNNYDCEIGSIICFYQFKTQQSFKINLDALTQAKVHIDPRVLLLAKNSEAAK